MNEHTRNEIVARHRQGQSLRSIARTLNISRKAVANAIAAASKDPLQPNAGASGNSPLLAPFEPSIEQWLDRHPHITVVRLLEELRAEGYQGGYTILREHVKKRRSVSPAAPVMRFETAPGKQAQMDWAVYTIDFTEQGSRKVNLFSYLLGYSRRQYLRFTESQDMATLMRQHVLAFEYFGGVAAECLYDNMKTVVDRWEDEAPVYNTRFLSFATHYGFRPRACRPRRAQTKGKVERAFRYAEGNLLNARSFRSLEHLNEVTADWLAGTADVRVLRQRGKTPMEAFAEEQPCLLSLPEHPYDTAPVIYRDVNAEGYVTIPFKVSRFGLISGFGAGQ